MIGGLDDLPKLDGLDTIIIEASATNASQRRRVFALLAVTIKRDIIRLANGRWQAIIRLGLADELKVIGRTRADTESAIDRFAEIVDHRILLAWQKNLAKHAVNKTANPGVHSRTLACKIALSTHSPSRTVRRYLAIAGCGDRLVAMAKLTSHRYHCG